MDYQTHVGLASTGMVTINGARTANLNGVNYTATGLSPSTSYFFQVYSVTSANIQGVNAQRVTGQTLAPRESVNLMQILYFLPVNFEGVGEEIQCAIYPHTLEKLHAIA